MGQRREQKRILTMEMKQLITLIQCMNAIHSDELGDFRCLRSNDQLSEYIAQNYALREILERIYAINEEGDETSSTLKLDCSRVFDRTQRINRIRRLQTLFAVKSFLRLNEDEAARKYLGLASLIRSLPEKVKLINLDISRNALDDNDAIVASDAFRGLTTLCELNMSYNQIGVRGAGAIFSVLLSHPSCHIQTLDLQWNWNICHNQGLDDKLVHVLQHHNRSLVLLNLSGTQFAPSMALAQVFYDFSDEGNLFDVPAKYNHHLMNVALESGGTIEANNLLLSALGMNEGSPSEALARKIGHFLENNKAKIYEDQDERDLVFRTLEFVGKYGSLTSMFKSLQRFTANGSL